MGLFDLYTTNFLMLVSVQCKTASHGPCLFQWGRIWEHSLVKVAKLQCKNPDPSPCLFWWGVLEHSLVKVAKLQYKTAGHGHCLFWWGQGEFRNIIWLRLQIYNVELLAVVLVYSSGRDWESQSFLVQNCFLSPNNFHDVDHKPLSYRVGNKGNVCNSILCIIT